MPRYFFDIKDGKRIVDPAGFVCDDDVAALNRTAVIAVGISIDHPADDPERRVAIIDDEGRDIGTVPVYSVPSETHSAK